VRLRSRTTAAVISVATLFFLLTAAGTVGYGVLIHAIHRSNSQWCIALDELSSITIAKPVNPAATPGREALYRQYEAYLGMRGKFGCV